MGTLLLASLLLLVSCTQGLNVGQHNREVVCYLGAWSIYRPFAGKFSVNDINPTLCTHLVYAFAGLDEVSNRIKSLDPEYDFTQRAYADIVSLRRLNPKMKVSIAIGGWTEGSTKYSNMAANPTSRRTFINSIVKFIKEYKFDGLDLDWEYPASRGGAPSDKENFVTLVKELHEAFKPYGWILTAAVGVSKDIMEKAYDIPALSKYLDFIHLMAYDYHGKWDGFTGHNAPLYPRDDESDEQKFLNVEYTVNHYLKKGAPPHKLILGAGLYGRTFLLTNSSNFGMNAPTKNSAFAGPYTREDGYMGYNEICEKQKNETGLWNVAWNRGHQAPYMFRDNMWISYDDDFSLQAKVRFAQEHGLGGMMIWSIDTDDFKGRCGKGKFPLLRAINKALQDTEKSRPHPDSDINFDLDDDNSLDNTRYSIISGYNSASNSIISILTIVAALSIANIFA